MSKGNKYAMIFIALAGLIYVLSPILMPFLSAALLAYLGDPGHYPSVWFLWLFFQF